MSARVRAWGARRGPLALALAVTGLALSAAPGMATTDRVDYSDQANPICKSTNNQVLHLYDSIEAEEQRLENAHRLTRKQARKIFKRIDRLYEQIPFRFVELFRAELEQLKAILPPPGYENDVASWLATRGEIGTLYLQYLQIEQQLEGSEGPRPHSRKGVNRRAKRRATLHSLESQVESKLVVDLETDLELGSKLGAAYCVTGADGEIAVNIVASGD